MSTLSTPPRTPPGAPLGAGAPKPAGEPPPGSAGPSVRERSERAALLVTLALILGASAAFIHAQALKLEPSPLKRPRAERSFSPRCGCKDKATATLLFSLRRAGRLEVQVTDLSGRVVRTLARGSQAARGPHRLEWDGRDDAGRIARDGSYRWRLTLDGGRRLAVPSPVRLDTRPPRAALISVRPRAIALGRSPRAAPPRGGGRPAAAPTERMAVRYRADEAARASLLVDGRAAVRSRWRQPGTGTLVWSGSLGGRTVDPGVHRLSVRLRDRAGNSGAPTRSIPVRVRRAGRR